MPLAKLAGSLVTSSSSDHLIITRSTTQIHITQRLHPPAWEDQPTTIQERINNYINDHGRTNLSPCRKSFNNYINNHGRTNLPPCRKISAFTSMTMGGPTYHHVAKAYVYLRLPDSSLPLGRNLNLKYTKLLSKVLKLHSS